MEVKYGAKSSEAKPSKVSHITLHLFIEFKLYLFNSDMTAITKLSNGPIGALKEPGCLILDPNLIILEAINPVLLSIGLKMITTWDQVLVITSINNFAISPIGSEQLVLINRYLIFLNGMIQSVQIKWK